MRKILFCSVAMAAVGLLAMAPQASATPLLPGSVLTSLDTFTASDALGETLVDSFTSTIQSDDHLTAQVIAEVRRNASGFLDFFYQVINQGTAIDSTRPDRMTTTNFGTFTTDASQSSEAFGSFVTPTLTAGMFTGADRDPAGSTVGFDLARFALVNGDASYIAKVSTNATEYGGGFTHAIDGGDVRFNTFAPVPEPSDLLLLGTGLFGLAAILRRRKANAL